MKFLQSLNTISQSLNTNDRYQGLKRTFITVIKVSFLLASLLSANLFVANMVQADAGHKHKGEQTDELPALIKPRMIASSDLIELVAILNGTILTFYLDDYATNKPLVDVALLVEGPSGEQQAEAQEDGTFLLHVDWLASPGSYDMLMTVSADNWDDLLPGTLVIPEADTGADPQGGVPLLWMIALTLLFLLAVVIFWSINKSKRQASTLSSTTLSSTIVLALLLWSGMPLDSIAHEEHAKAKTPPPPSNVNRPTRLPDGSLFVPKPAQRILTLRTLVAQEQALAVSLLLNGHVIPAPSFSGLVQSVQAARIEPAKIVFPFVGQKVAAGQLLTYVVPIANSLEVGSQRAELAELSAELKLAKKALHRVQQLQDIVSQKELEAALSRVESVKGRKTAVANSLFKRQGIFAPASGVISQVAVRAGQVIEARETLFEIIDPTKLWVKALAYDVPLANQAVAASAQTLYGDTLSLILRGVGTRLESHAVPIYLEIAAPFPPLSVEQPLKVWLKTAKQVTGIPVPVDSIRKSAGRTHVWLHTEAERFELREVDILPFDANRVVIIDGVESKERVVTVGAGTLNQIR